MGLMNFLFRKKKPLLLEEGKEKSKAESGQALEQVPMEVGIYSKKEGNVLEYNIRLNTNGNSIPIGKIVNVHESPDTNIKLKQISKEIENVFSPLSQADSVNKLEVAKRRVKNDLQELFNRNQRFILHDNTISCIDNFVSPNVLDYDTLQNLPIGPLSYSQINQYGTQLQSRLNELTNCNTPDKAYENRDGLVHFMKAQQKNLPNNPFISANNAIFSSCSDITEALKKIDEFDEHTIIENAKHLEKLDNEDGALYSVYLKIEERRIWDQIQANLLDYQGLIKDEDERKAYFAIPEILSQLDNFQLKPISGNFSLEILKYIISQMNQMDTANYTSNFKPLDRELADSVLKLENIKDKKKILSFLYSRMGSYGQLSYNDRSLNLDKSSFGNSKPKTELLRDFIANTDLKSSDNEESKNFLLLVAQIEKEYIQKHYSHILEYCTEKGNTGKSFKEQLAFDTNSVHKTSINKEGDIIPFPKQKDDSNVI